jgi:Tol biopolymer transport system component
VEPLLITTEFGFFRASVSPDGRWLAYSSNESRPIQTYVRPFPNVDNGRHLVSVAGGISPVWSPDGSELFYPKATR